jgi:hypothetical protein
MMLAVVGVSLVSLVVESVTHDWECAGLAFEG